MFKFRIGLNIFLSLSMFLFALRCYAEEEIENLIDIFEASGKIIAVIEGKKTIPFNLRSNENVIWSDSKGYLGACVTNDQFSAISTSSGGWQRFHLGAQTENINISISSNIAILVTEDRAIAFDAASSRFVGTQLPINDELISVKAEKNIAVVITSDKAIAFTTKRTTFFSIPFQVKETFEEPKSTSSKVIIRTSNRLLSFESKGSTWKEHRLN